MTMSNQAVQRTLVLTHGPIANEVGQQLPRQLGPVTAVVAVRDLPVDVSAVNRDDLREALRAISRITLRDELLRHGWTLDRLDEVALFLVLEMGEHLPPELPAGACALLAELADQQFGVSIAPLILALAPEPALGAAQRQLADLVAATPPTARGIIVMGSINELGLCLPTDNDLIQAATALLHILITTPLRDAPEWLATNYLAEGPLLQSAGLARWEWSPLWEQTLLAGYWVQQVLATWLAPAGKSESAPAWLDEQQLLPEQLARQPGRRSQPDRHDRLPQHPQPWRLHTLYRPLCQVSGVPKPPSNDRQLSVAAQALQTTARHRLDSHPAGGLAALEQFLQELRHALAELQERLAARGLVQAERETALAHRQSQLTERLTAGLAQWPEASPATWVTLLLRPWRWPRLAARYRQLERLAQQLQQVRLERAAWQWQLAQDDASDALYTALAGEVGQWQRRADELRQMLLSLQRVLASEVTHWPAAVANPETYLPQRYAQLVDSPIQEAAWAAQYVGGLGEQLSWPDDGFLEPLRLAGRERLATMGPFGAVDTLALLYPRPEELAAWWQQQWAMAAPLWRFDEAAQGDRQRRQASTYQIVCGQDAPLLETVLDLPAGSNMRYIPAATTDLIFVQLRTGLPLYHDPAMPAELVTAPATQNQGREA